MENTTAIETVNESVDETISQLQAIASSDFWRGLLIGVIILAITIILARVIKKICRKILSIDGMPLPSNTIIENILTVIIWAIGIGLILNICFGIDVNGLIAALGITGIAISLGLQDTLKNIFGGLQITVMRILQPGDHVVIGSVEGIVQDVSWRQTTVLDYEKCLHLIPNAIINSTTVSKVDPSMIVTSTVVLNNDGRDIDEMIREMEILAKTAIEKVTPLARDPWILVTQIGEYGVWTKLRFVLEDTSLAREARDAALRAIAPYTRNSSNEILQVDDD